MNIQCRCFPWTLLTEIREVDMDITSLKHSALLRPCVTLTLNFTAYICDYYEDVLRKKEKIRRSLSVNVSWKEMTISFTTVRLHMQCNMIHRHSFAYHVKPSYLSFLRVQIATFRRRKF